MYQERVTLWANPQTFWDCYISRKSDPLGHSSTNPLGLLYLLENWSERA